MAKKDTRASKDEPVVTRVKAADTRSSAKKPTKTAKAPAVKAETSSVDRPKNRANPLKATGGYFKGAWEELRQVRWPNRRATWSLTAAMLGFTAFFVVLILLLDALFKYVFQLILG